MNEAVVVRYRTTPESADENQRLVEQVYAELAERQPDGLRYLTVRLEDGVSFVHVALQDDAAVLPQLAAFRSFQSSIGDRVEAPPDATSATLVGSYRVLDEPASSHRQS